MYSIKNQKEQTPVNNIPHMQNNFINSFSINEFNQNKNSHLNYQSPKISGGKYRPGTSIGFSVNDINAKYVNLNGIKTKEAYELNTMYNLYGNFLKYPKTNFIDYIEEEKSLNKKGEKSGNLNNKLVPLNNEYFKNYQNEYNSLLTETQKNFHQIKKEKLVIKNKSNVSNVLNSDCIFNENISKTNTSKANKINVYRESDIFNLNKRISSAKTSENYSIDDFSKVVKPYTVSSKSNSEWISFNAHPTLLGHTNSEFHLLNPLIKNISQTKKEILKCQNFNPIHRQKMLSEYIDITRVGCPNPNQDFRKIISQNKFVLNRTSDLCTTFLDNHHKNYNNLCSKPFKK